jgi:hypothetical protein
MQKNIKINYNLKRRGEKKSYKQKRKKYLCLGTNL